MKIIRLRNNTLTQLSVVNPTIPPFIYLIIRTFAIIVMKIDRVHVNILGLLVQNY